ncbi:MAG: hypothetical protein FWF51_08505 [Chitinivibrionia bacterium]|nr:hypothetical protein [Chitinivibrionia bacterium]
MLKKFILFVLVATFVFAEPTLINLDVSDKKTIGRSKGLLNDREMLKKQAISAAKGESDVLLEQDFFYEEKDDSLFVTVTGFPANYASAATSVKSAAQKELKIPASSVIPASAPQKEISVFEDEKTKYKSGLYVSAKTQTSIPWSSMGGNFQIGYFAGRTFVGGDFGVGKGDYDDFGYYTILEETKTNFYCGSLSFGGRIKPNDNFQVIIGATIGMYTKFETEYYYYDDYYSSRYSERYREVEKVLAQGPFAKFLFRPYRTNAKQKFGDFWFEISNKFVFGYPYAAYNIEVGITYAP